MYFDFAQYKQKGFAPVTILVGSLVVIGIIIGTFYLSKISNPICAWFTDQYKNALFVPCPQSKGNKPTVKKEYSTFQKLGFSFQYPEDLVVKEDSEEEFNKRGNGDFRKNFKGYVGYEVGKFLGAVVVLDKSNSYETNPFTIWVFNNDNNLTIDTWYKNYWYYPFVWGDFTQIGKVELAPKDEATISGYIGKSGVIDYQEGKPKFIYLSKDKKMYLFRIIGEIGDKVLSSFKFLQ